MSTILHRITDAWTQAWGSGETAAFEELVAPNYKRSSKTVDEALAEVLRQVKEQHGAFSNFTIRIQHAIEDDNLVAIHWESTGTHTGAFMGVPPTGRTVTVQGAAFISHQDGKVTEESAIWDPRDLLASLKIWHLGDFLRSSL